MINILTGIDSTSSALNAERIRMDVVSQNLANVNTTRGPNGKPYVRQQVVFEAVLKDQLRPSGTPGSEPQMVRVAQVEAARRPLRTVYQPGHADADANGMVAMPNINIHEEMVDLMAASRSYTSRCVTSSAREFAKALRRAIAGSY